MENEETVMRIAETCQKICVERKLTYVFKASFDKANRTSVNSFRGMGIEQGLKLLQKVKDNFSVAVTTDIHESWQAAPAGEAADILQIPAFLCRQTDLLTAASKTGKIVNIKKAQFLSAAEMAYPAEKVKNAGNDKIILTERGSMFGYNNLVVDFRNLVDMRELGFPVVMDVTHSTQRPGGLGGKSGGDRKYAEAVAKAAAAVGVNGYFFEVHPDPDNALSDGPNMIPLHDFPVLLDNVIRHHCLSA
jgi:2-dehydro-3-deoxyphosphooctonate aldolase (KDO 8-P synthase)